MAQIDDIIQSVALALNMTEPKHQPAIKAQILRCWAYLAVADDWWFLREATPYQLSLVSGKTDYEIAQDEVGYMLYLADSDGKELAFYRDWYDAKRRQTDVGPGEQPVLFEIAGMANGHPLIRFDRDWPTAQTAKLHYNKRGDEASLSLLPDAWIWVLEHKVKSMMAMPVQARPDYWMAMTKAEYFLFQAGLAEMRQRVSPILVRKRDPEVYPEYLNAIEEAGTL